MNNLISTHNQNSSAHSSLFNSKVDKNQGSANNGKFLKVDNGSVVCESVTIPTNTNQLTNGANFITINDVPEPNLDNYITAQEAASLLSSSVSIQIIDNFITSDMNDTSGAGFMNMAQSEHIELEPNVIYFVENSSGGNSYYNEYMYLEDIDTCELIGTTETDLSDYLTTSAAASTYQPKGSYVTSNDQRLSDTREPTDGTVTNAKVASNANIAFSKLNISKNDILGLGISGTDTTYDADEITLQKDSNNIFSIKTVPSHTHNDYLTTSDFDTVEVVVTYTDDTTEILDLVLNVNGEGQIVDSVILTYDNINFIVNVYDSNGNGVSNKTVAIYRNQYQDGSGNYNYDFDVTTDNNGSVTFENPHQQYSYFKAICDGVESNIATDTIETPPIDDL